MELKKKRWFEAETVEEGAELLADEVDTKIMEEVEKDET